MRFDNRLLIEQAFEKYRRFAAAHRSPLYLVGCRAPAPPRFTTCSRGPVSRPLLLWRPYPNPIDDLQPVSRNPRMLALQSGLAQYYEKNPSRQDPLGARRWTRRIRAVLAHTAGQRADGRRAVA